LARWDATGDPGPAATYDQRLDFMDRHFHLLVEHRGERFACLTFRKVANWYCRSLRTEREVQQALVMLDRVATFDRIVAELRENEPLRQRFTAGAANDFHIAVPKGPVEHW